MKMVVDLNDSIISEISELAHKKNVAVEVMLELLIIAAVNKCNKNKKSPSVREGTSAEESNLIMEILLRRVRKLAPKEEFTVKELIKDHWDDIHNLISFGHRAAKALRASGMVVDIPSTTASRRYRKI